jgi:hypothetical protein
MQFLRQTFLVGMVMVIVCGLWLFAWADSLHRGPQAMRQPPLVNHHEPISGM